ncbi:MAG: hypothetical protein ABR968_00375 [Bacteroidales bacterium]|jgi:hypothetical protein
MKKTILTMAIIAFVAGTISTSYGQEPDKRSEKARTKLQAAQKDSVTTVYETLKKESEIRFNKNEGSIAEFKASIVNEKRKIRSKDESKVADLEQKNNYLKKKLKDYKVEGKENWTIFKAGFNQDMDNLNKSLNDLSVKKG